MRSRAQLRCKLLILSNVIFRRLESGCSCNVATVRKIVHRGDRWIVVFFPSPHYVQF